MAGENTSAGAEVHADDFIGAWRAQAACLDTDPNIFFPNYDGSGISDSEKALGICAVCAVQPECLTYALETNQQSGVWGGKDEDERHSYRKRWLAERRRNATR